MLPDPWLDRWLSLLIERSGSAPVLEVGCGFGDDTVTLARAGLDVSAFDLSAACATAARLRAPKARIMQRDVRAPLPIEKGSAGAVIASLSLHYFPWRETLEIFERIRAVLRVKGVLLSRLNSTQDWKFGACRGLGLGLEKNFYEQGGQTKRFFDDAAVDELFGAGWQMLSVEHMTTTKYLRQKNLWEVVVEKINGTDS